MNKAFLKFLILNFSFFILLSAACGRKKEAPVDLGPAPAVSAFVLKNLLSEFPGEIRTADYAGKVQLVLFFRSDDPACRGSVADWNALLKDFSGRGFVLVGVLVDDRDTDQIAAEALDLGAAFPVGLATDARLVDAFGGPAAIRAIPTAFLLDRTGNPVRIYAGFEPLAQIRDDVDRTLDGRSIVDRKAKPAVPEENAP